MKVVYKCALVYIEDDLVAFALRDRHLADLHHLFEECQEVVREPLLLEPLTDLQAPKRGKSLALGA